jgi:hypothetical protein
MVLFAEARLAVIEKLQKRMTCAVCLGQVKKKKSGKFECIKCGRSSDFVVERKETPEEKATNLVIPGAPEAPMTPGGIYLPPGLVLPAGVEQ